MKLKIPYIPDETQRDKQTVYHYEQFCVHTPTSEYICYSSYQARSIASKITEPFTITRETWMTYYENEEWKYSPEEISPAVGFLQAERV
jgi:hypothetical protein